jgi:acyl carrier protein
MLDERQQQALGVVRKTLQDNADAYADDAALLRAEIDALDIDSLGKLEMVMELEKEFGLMLNETEIAACRSVDDLVSLVVRTSAQPG